ncbi:MAG TPA: Hpt domain-containing protein [Caulobacteraceae bacterium]
MSDANQGTQASGGLRLRMGAVDPAAIARAEAALKSLSGNFAAWLAEEIAKLKAARARFDSEGRSEETCESLYLRAHDLKGLGATYEYPLVTRIAGSLCRLIGNPQARAVAPLSLIDAHIEAIETAVAGRIQSDQTPAGAALAHDLETRVEASRRP